MESALAQEITPNYEDVDASSSILYSTTQSSLLEEDDLPHLETTIVPTIMFVILLIGLVGNSIVIYVILRAGNGRVKSATNCYIVNLAMTDIAFLLCCVPWTSVVYMFSDWKFGRFLCRFVFYMMHVTAQATCLTLTAMSIDRYKAIVRPLRSMQDRSVRAVVMIISSIWLFSVITGIPVFVYSDIGHHRHSDPEASICQDIWPHESLATAYAFYCMVLMYLAPLVVISICYIAVIVKVWGQVMPGLDGGNRQYGKDIRQRRHVTWMVLIVVIVFAFCWLPLYVFQVWYRLAGENFPTTLPAYSFKIASNLLAYSNSCLNPFIYAFLGQNFRRQFGKACPLFHRAPRNPNGVGASRRSDLTSVKEHHRMVEMRSILNHIGKKTP